MKLSDAILLGSAISRQGFGNFFRDGRTCALGSALEAIGVKHQIPSSEWAWLEYPAPHCPVCGELPAWGKSFMVVIAGHLNDTHRWTRESIAAWVATVEPQDTDQQLIDGGQVTRHGQSSETNCVDEKVISDAL